MFLNRLDFANFVTSVTAVTGACVDSFIVTSPTGGATTTICGTNTNLHSKKNLLLKIIYVTNEVRPSNSS